MISYIYTLTRSKTNKETKSATVLALQFAVSRTEVLNPSKLSVKKPFEVLHGSVQVILPSLAVSELL